MEAATRCGRILSPVRYESSAGREGLVPIGPCLIEDVDGWSIDIVWGEHGECSAALSVEAFDAARDDGHLVILD